LGEDSIRFIVCSVSRRLTCIHRRKGMLMSKFELWMIDDEAIILREIFNKQDDALLILKIPSRFRPTLLSVLQEENKDGN